MAFPVPNIQMNYWQNDYSNFRWRANPPNLQDRENNYYLPDMNNECFSYEALASSFDHNVSDLYNTMDVEMDKEQNRFVTMNNAEGGIDIANNNFDMEYQRFNLANSYPMEVNSFCTGNDTQIDECYALNIFPPLLNNENMCNNNNSDSNVQICDDSLLMKNSNECKRRESRKRKQVYDIRTDTSKGEDDIDIYEVSTIVLPSEKKQKYRKITTYKSSKINQKFETSNDGTVTNKSKCTRPSKKSTNEKHSEVSGPSMIKELPVNENEELYREESYQYLSYSSDEFKYSNLSAMFSKIDSENEFSAKNHYLFDEPEKKPEYRSLIKKDNLLAETKFTFFYPKIDKNLTFNQNAEINPELLTGDYLSCLEPYESVIELNNDKLLYPLSFESILQHEDLNEVAKVDNNDSILLTNVKNEVDENESEEVNNNVPDILCKQILHNDSDDISEFSPLHNPVDSHEDSIMDGNYDYNEYFMQNISIPLSNEVSENSEDLPKTDENLLYSNVTDSSFELDSNSAYDLENYINNGKNSGKSPKYAEKLDPSVDYAVSIVSPIRMKFIKKSTSNLTDQPVDSLNENQSSFGSTFNMATEVSLDTWKCSECVVTMPTEILMEIHVASMHGGDITNKCNKCCMLFKRKHKYKKHVAKCQRATLYICDFCEKPYKLKKVLDKHTSRCQLQYIK